jgi:biotin carboxyl carrier protein/biotin carboxylase (EC 6.3.4.14)
LALELKRRPLAYYVRHRGFAGEVMMLAARAATLYARLPERAPADTAKQVISPMPGLVVSMEVAVGQDVKAGQTICVIEAMKMQNILRAERDGKVKTLSARAGDSVAADQVLVEFA